MKFRIIYTKRAAKDISGLAPDVKERLKEALEGYSEAPLHYARKMADPFLGNYRFRIGDYRVIFDLEGDEIVVLRVGHRRDIYRRS